MNGRTNNFLRYGPEHREQGVANCGDSTEVSCIGFILANPVFQVEMLENDLTTRGAWLTSSIYAGMLLGGIVVSERSIWTDMEWQYEMSRSS